ncbi:unnamed protein product [Cuscuta campestris]|uniref:Epidermal patterning factor-like protein n=1 Tax=Cuscuta campestris TaxID=132261 RepID=A0A484NI68_9ASTE|nr:unnamed protein product [Cuscuta campestris]
MGSKPPRCERRCGGSCQQCEAIQVPTTGAKKNGIIKHSSSSSSSPLWWWRSARRTTSGRGDDDNYSSNYKPMSWKCKCGNLIFDP